MLQARINFLNLKPVYQTHRVILLCVRQSNMLRFPSDANTRDVTSTLPTLYNRQAGLLQPGKPSACLLALPRNKSNNTSSFAPRRTTNILSAPQITKDQSPGRSCGCKHIVDQHLTGSKKIASGVKTVYPRRLGRSSLAVVGMGGRRLKSLKIIFTRWVCPGKNAHPILRSRIKTYHRQHCFSNTSLG